MSPIEPQIATDQAREQDLTVLFADISGFTAMSEKLDPETVTDIMNRCFTDLESVIVGYGGSIDKYIGDCVMAIFGLNQSGSDAVAAVTTAGELLATLDDFNSREKLESPLGLHIGIESGRTLVGEIGGAGHRSVTVSGSSVTIASRLEDVSDVGEIFVGPKTHSETRETFEYVACDPVPVRDSAQPVAVYQYLRNKRAREGIKRDSERRQATVVFASINGFNDLAATLSAADYNRALNLCFGVLEAAVKAYGGVIDKYIGETVMALFGVPDAIEDAPKQAINAAIEMRKRLSDLYERGQVPIELTLSTGINSGLVIAGEIGGRVKRDFTVMGDTVNLAARLKEAAARGEILIGPATSRFTEGHFELRDSAPLSLKGKAEPVIARSVESDTEQLHRTSSADGGAKRVGADGVPMVGRRCELEEIRNRLSELIGGKGGSLAVSGDAGVGKTRLLAEVLQLPQAQAATVIQGRCISLGGNLSFHPFVDLLRRWGGVRDDDREDQAAQRVERAIRSACGERASDIYPFVARMMGLSLSGKNSARVQGIEGEALENMITNAMRELLNSLSSVHPVLLILEDLHWADQSSVKLLDTLLRLPAQSPVLFLFLTRPHSEKTSDHVEERAAAILGDSHRRIDLTPLSDQDSLVLAQALLDIEDLPVSFRNIVTRKAEGNPFYIEEVVRSLIDSGAIVEENGTHRVTQKIDSVEIPNTIQEVIMSRVDRLDEATRHVVQIASVVGRSALFSIIEEILSNDDKLDSAGEAELERLKDKQLLLERRATSISSAPNAAIRTELEFVFKHALAQEAIYASLLQKVRRDLHKRVASAIESLYTDRISDFYGMLAYHYSRTDELAKAEDYLFKAGDEAANSAASGEALNYFRDAYRIFQEMHGDGGDPVRKSALEKRIALALLNSGEQTESIDHFDDSLRLLGEPVPKSIWAAGVRFIGDITAVLFHVYVGHRFRKPSTSVDFDHESNVCEIFYHRGQAETTSDPKRLFLELPNGLRRLNRIDSSRIEKAGSIYVTAALIFAYSGVSFPISRRMLDIAHSLVRPDNPRDSFVYQVFDYVYHYLLGNWDEDHSIPHAEVQQALERGQVWDATLFVGLEIDRLAKRGDFDRTHAYLTMLTEINDNYGYTYAGSNRNGMKAVVLVEQRDLRNAAVLARTHYIESDEPPIRVFSLGLEAKALAMLGDIDGAKEALALADKAIAKAESISSWHLSTYWTAQLHCTLVQMRSDGTARGVARDARRTVNRAVRTAGYVAKNRVEILRLAGDVCAVLGNRSRARKFYSQSWETGEKMGTRAELARLRISLANFLNSSEETFLGAKSSEHRAAGEQELSAMNLTWDFDPTQGLRDTDFARATEPRGSAA